MKAIDGELGHLPSTIFKRQGHADKNKERPNGDRSSRGNSAPRAGIAPLAQGSNRDCSFSSQRSLAASEGNVAWVYAKTAERNSQVREVRTHACTYALADIYIYIGEPTREA